MKIDRVKNAKKNVIFGILYKAVLIIMPFITRTVIQYTIGTEYLGLNSLLKSILSVLSLSELGFSSAIVYSMYKPVAEDDYKALCSLLNFYRKIFKIIGIIILAIGVVILPFVPRLIHGDCPENTNIYVIYLIYVIDTAISYLLFAYLSSILAAYQRNDVVSFNNMIFVLLMNTAQVLMLIVFRNYYLFTLMMPLFTVLNNLRIYIVARRMFPNIIPKGWPSRDVIEDVKTRVKGVFLIKLCIQTRNSLDSIFISFFLGLSMTAIYNNYYYIMFAAVSMMTIISPSIAGGVGNSIVTDSVEKNYNDLIKFEFLYLRIAGWMTTCLLCLIQPFMKIWMGDSMVLPLNTVILFAAYFYALMMGDMKFLYIEATGMWWDYKFVFIIQTITNLILNYTLGKWLGVFGIILATLLSIFLLDFCYGTRIVFYKYFGAEKLQQYYRRQFMYVGVTTLVTALTFLLCSLIKLGNIEVLLIRTLICSVVPNILYFIIYRNYNLAKDSMRWFKSVVIGKRVSI